MKIKMFECVRNVCACLVTCLAAASTTLNQLRQRQMKQTKNEKKRNEEIKRKNENENTDRQLCYTCRLQPP